MKKNTVKILLFVLAVIITGCKNDKWSYQEQNQWKTQYTDCGGNEQSPIDITTADTNRNMKPLFLDYYTVDTFKAEIIPHKLLKIYTPGTLVVPDSVYLGHEYYLNNIHFHTPSEHTVQGKHYPMEIHFVHRDTAGKAATVAVFVKEGKENPALKTILDNLPRTKNKKETVVAELNINQLIPSSLSYWYYEGSKASPPCTQGMKWFVMQQPIEASKAQIEKLQKIFGKNIRDIQPLNKRTIYQFSLSN